MALAMLGAVALVACSSDDGDSEGAGDAAPDAVEDTAEPLDADGDTPAPDAADPDADDADDVFVDPNAVLQPAEGEVNFATAADGWYRGDLHYHTDYSDDAREQGGDPLAMCLEIADAFRDPVFVDKHPELAGNGLDFIAITDHRTAAALEDPDFGHDHLIVIPGEEYGGSGHANIFGIKEFITHEPADGQSQADRQRDAIEEAHGMGAFFSINHPMDGNNWPYDTPDIDGIEVWNGPWAGFNMGTSDEDLEDSIAGAGEENPFIRDAQTAGGGNNGKALRLWRNHLTAGIHVAVIGGSDRHMLVPAGLPTTYVRRPSDAEFDGLEGPDLGWEGVVAGFHEGGTFISRSTFGPQVDLEAVDGEGQSYGMGAALPHGGTWTVRVRVSRAVGGVLRLVAGPRKPAETDGTYRAEPEVIFEEAIHHDLVEGEVTWEVPAAGGWLHAVVLDDLRPDPLPEGPVQDAYDSFQEQVSEDALKLIGQVLIPLADRDVVFAPSECDPDEWEPWQLECMPVDDYPPLPTFYVPDRIDRLLHIFFDDDGESTEFAMGAITSAFMAPPEE
ncbi:MAG: CehA/McbA family metallohydrolase [Myxococcota bacterium]